MAVRIANKRIHRPTGISTSGTTATWSGCWTGSTAFL